MFAPRNAHLKALACGASLLFTALVAAPALAEDPEAGGLFYAVGSFANIHGLPLSVEGEANVEPDPLKGKRFRLEGGGRLFGGGLQVNIYGKHVRGGLAIAMFGVEGTKVRYDALSNGFSVRAAGAWGASVDAFIGHEFGRAQVRPYFDLVGTFAAVGASVDLMHPEFGTLGRTGYQGWLFGFGPRAGLSVPIADTFFFDLSGMYSIVGMERFRVVAGIGVWSRKSR
jgi:hypothetical protein